MKSRRTGNMKIERHSQVKWKEQRMAYFGGTKGQARQGADSQ